MSLFKKEKDGMMSIEESPPVRMEKPKNTEIGRRSSGQSLIGQGLTIEGEIKGDDELMIEGKVSGKINTSKGITVGQTGHVTADVHGDVVTVTGKVSGNITAKKKVILKPTSTVLGDIRCPSFIVNEGAAFEGKIHMEAKGTPARPSKSQPDNKMAENR